MVNPAKNDQKKTSDTAPVFGKSTCDKSQSTISGKSMAVNPEDILKSTPLSSKYLLGEDNSKRSQTGLADAFDQKKTVEKTKINKNDSSEVSSSSDEGMERSISTSPEKETPPNEGNQDNTVVICSSDSESSNDSSGGSDFMMSDSPAVERKSNQGKPTSPESAKTNQKNTSPETAKPTRKEKNTKLVPRMKRYNFQVKKHSRTPQYIEFRDLASNVQDKCFKVNEPDEGTVTIGGKLMNFDSKGLKNTRMKNLLALILGIDWKKDIATGEADFPFLRKNSGPCVLHSDTIEPKVKGKVLVSSVIYLDLKYPITFNLWNMEYSDLSDDFSLSDGSSLPAPTLKIKVEEGDIITFPAHNLHSVTVKDENKKEERFMAVISYYISKGNDEYSYWDGSAPKAKKANKRRKPEKASPKPEKASPETLAAKKEVQNPYTTACKQPKRQAHIAAIALESSSRISSQGSAKNTIKNRQTDDATWARFNKFTDKEEWKVGMKDIITEELLNENLWEEFANCLANLENIDGNNNMGEDRFELGTTTVYKYLNQAMNNAYLICKKRGEKLTSRVILHLPRLEVQIPISTVVPQTSKKYAKSSIQPQYQQSSEDGLQCKCH